MISKDSFEEQSGVIVDNGWAFLKFFNFKGAAVTACRSCSTLQKGELTYSLENSPLSTTCHLL